ncbi:TetR/AcrR family transcriptional regulator [Jatrophihabitans sp. GAS493]|uniref:TetR/AcrR family transcriptional regulator n=1 Tax=Jatrophihabitans sp. GAS493 TaxID=1907575 RepID=UPI000BB93802|nr:TetR/AcrR family transcriptional regulator [Jatrophihabitans sp. GAS493]
MTNLAPNPSAAGPDRISRRQVDKFAERRAQLAGSALLTLSELGYTRTSLREIAQNSEFSHGVLHYYFKDKLDLITEGVRQYKAVCVLRYDDVVEQSRTADELLAGFGATMAETLRCDAPTHRLWYDLRTQSFFEPGLREDIVAIDAGLERMIWRVVARFGQLAGTPITVSSAVAYGLFDGIFQQALLKYSFGEEDAPEQLQQTVQELLKGLLTRP